VFSHLWLFVEEKTNPKIHTNFKTMNTNQVQVEVKVEVKPHALCHCLCNQHISTLAHQHISTLKKSPAKIPAGLFSL
jgi:hypothetical protein